MNSKRTIVTHFALATLLLCGMATTASASDVEARLSSREAYVGMPVVLQVMINNAEDYREPTVPEIDGCDVRSSGAASQSSQITIINGRRSASRSITMRYLITPRRAGTFEIPSLTLNVDGRDVQTRPQRFVATKSDTGDLMFAEIEGGKEKVYVGEPLDLTLKIWIKPYRDRQNKITLSEANMWQMISQQTSWGSFADKIKELAENKQRPGGREVLRENGQGGESSYFLYEIEATVYPKRPGKIDADDVQIVANYPTALGKSRDPFDGMISDSFFKNSPLSGRSPFGGNSPMSQMMNDDFFSSPFSNRLSVTSARPIVAEAMVDATEVIAIPTAGRPDDYRGAVGKYQMATQATPTHVSAGDPITFNIGIAGTGPMELVQAPPLATLPSLTADFKVTDEPLAGFVQDESKVFSTSIRPRREGITQIPAIPFSFFDPETESFETVMSEPISITVDKSDSLALDAIVGNSRRNNKSSGNDTTATNQLAPDFSNFESASVLVPQAARANGQWWWALAAFPPMIWLVTLLVRNRNAIANRLPSFKSAEARCLGAIERASDRSHVVTALTKFIGQRTGKPCSDSTSAVGALRTFGLNSVANEVESFFARHAADRFSGIQVSMTETRQSAREMAQQLESAFASSKKSQVKRAANRVRQTGPGQKSATHRMGGTAKMLTMLIIGLATLAGSAGTTLADEGAIPVNPVDTTSQLAIELNQHQQETIFDEANQIYAQAGGISDSDSAEAKDLFTAAAGKYQLLVDSGIRNSQLYFNLGNAYLQSGELGQAIVSYEQARALDPGHEQLAVNLEFANSLVTGQVNDATSSSSGESLFSIARFQAANEVVVGTLGFRSIVCLLVISAWLFWGFLTARVLGCKFPVWRFAAVPLLFMMLSIASCGLSASATPSAGDGVVVTNQLTLHAGDGEQFDVVSSIEAFQGHRVHVLAHRGNWIQIRTAAGDQGWIRDQNVKRITL